MTKKQQALRALLVGAAAYCALLILATYFGARYVETFAPLYRWQIQNLLPDYSVGDVAVLSLDAGKVIQVEVTRAQPHIIEGTVLYSGGTATCATLLGYALQHLIIMGTLLIAWPGFSWRDRMGLFVCAVPALLAVELIDVPFVLGGGITGMILESIDAERAASAPMVIWVESLDIGGRVTISIAAALFVIWIYRAVIRRVDFSREKHLVAARAVASHRNVTT